MNNLSRVVLEFDIEIWNPSEPTDDDSCDEKISLLGSMLQDGSMSPARKDFYIFFFLWKRKGKYG